MNVTSKIYSDAHSQPTIPLQSFGNPGGCLQIASSYTPFSQQQFQVYKCYVWLNILFNKTFPVKKAK